MPDVSGPFSGTAFLQGPWYRDKGYTEPSGVQGVPQNTAAAGDLGLTTNGLTVTMALGRAHVRGAYYERTGTAASFTLNTNTSTAGPRIDRLVLRRDLTAGTVTPTIVQGTAGASPTAPALIQVEDGVWDEPLFRLSVPANSGTTVTVADERRWVSSGVRLGPQISGTLARTDGSSTLNVNSQTNLMTQVVSQRGAWSTYTAADGVGVHCDLPGVYLVSAMILDNTAADRYTALSIAGTLAGTVGAVNQNSGFGGCGGMMPVEAPNGLDLYFQWYSSATVSGTIRASRFDVRWLENLT
jgi:hypothetical protein